MHRTIKRAWIFWTSPNDKKCHVLNGIPFFSLSFRFLCTNLFFFTFICIFSILFLFGSDLIWWTCDTFSQHIVFYHLFDSSSPIDPVIILLDLVFTLDHYAYIRDAWIKRISYYRRWNSWCWGEIRRVITFGPIGNVQFAGKRCKYWRMFMILRDARYQKSNLRYWNRNSFVFHFAGWTSFAIVLIFRGIAGIPSTVYRNIERARRTTCN